MIVPIPKVPWKKSVTITHKESVNTLARKYRMFQFLEMNMEMESYGAIPRSAL